MALPGVKLTTVDGNLGLVDSVADKPLYVGTCSSGVANTLYTFSQPSAVVSTLGRGPVVTAACHALEVMAASGGGSVDVFKTAGSVAASLSAVTASGGGPAVTVTGTPNNRYSAIIRIRAGGAIGTSTFDYSLDGGKNYSDIRTTAASFVIPNTGITANFAAGTYVLNETYSFTATPATYNTTDLTAAITALLLLNDRWKFVCWTGTAADGTTGATNAAAIAGHMTSLANAFRLCRGFVDCGTGTAASIITAFAATEDLRLACFYGDQRIIVADPIEGFKEPEVPYLFGAAARAASLTRGSNIGWVGAGKLKRAGTSISFDERQQGEQLHNKKINATTTYVGKTGYYPVNGLLKSPAGSDFRYIHWGMAFDLLCETVIDGLLPYVNASLRINTDGSGTVHELDCARIDKQLNALIRTAVLEPLTEQGIKGFFSAAEAKVDRTYNTLTTKTLKVDVRAVPLANTEQVDITAGLYTSLTTAEATTEEAA